MFVSRLHTKKARKATTPYKRKQPRLVRICRYQALQDFNLLSLRNIETCGTHEFVTVPIDELLEDLRVESIPEDDEKHEFVEVSMEDKIKDLDGFY